MKILFCSDIHGNDDAFFKVFNYFEKHHIDEMIVIGDIFSSFFCGSASDIELSKMFYKLAGHITFIKGNCDSPHTVDLLPTGLLDDYKVTYNNYLIQCFHGHRYVSIDSNTKLVVNGHTHVGKILKEKNTYYLNPGSVGRSRDKTNGSFMVLDNNICTIYDLNYDVMNMDEIQ